MEMAEDSRKRRRLVGAAADRLGDLPDCLLHDVLSRLGSRQAVQTSVLSRRWRHLWRDVPCVDLDPREFHLDQPELGSGQRDSLVNFADMLTTLPATTPLDAFRLHLDDHYRHRTDNPGRWLSRGLRRLPTAVHIHGGGILWPPPGTNSAGCARLTRLHLLKVGLPTGFGEHLGEQCPVLEELHIEGCREPGLTAITSRTLRSLAVIDHRGCRSGTDLVRAAPRLASLRLDLLNDGLSVVIVDVGAPPPAPHQNEPLASVVEASICVWEPGYQLRRRKRLQKQGQQEFLRSMCSLLARLPAVTNLRLDGFTTTALLEEESQEFPVLHNLRTMLLQGCDVGVKFEALTSILGNTPSLEKLGLHHCKSLCRPITKKRKTSGSSKRRSSTATSAPVCKNLKSIEIKGEYDEHAPHQSSPAEGFVRYFNRGGSR